MTCLPNEQILVDIVKVMLQELSNLQQEQSTRTEKQKQNYHVSQQKQNRQILVITLTHVNRDAKFLGHETPFRITSKIKWPFFAHLSKFYFLNTFETRHFTSE